MSASTNMIGDQTTVITNGPAAATIAAAIAAAGPINDYVGNCKNALVAMQGIAVHAAMLAGVTASGDDSTNKGLLNGIVALFKGTASPSTQATTDLKTVISNGPSTTTKANSLAAAGPINDYVGNCYNLLSRLNALQVLLTLIKNTTDTGTDGTNKTLITNMITGLA